MIILKEIKLKPPIEICKEDSLTIEYGHKPILAHKFNKNEGFFNIARIFKLNTGICGGLFNEGRKLTKKKVKQLVNMVKNS